MNDCKTCRHGNQCGFIEAQNLRAEGYSVGAGPWVGRLTMACRLHKQVACEPCPQYEREPGTEGDA